MRRALTKHAADKSSKHCAGERHFTIKLPATAFLTKLSHVLLTTSGGSQAADKAGKPCPNHTSWGDFTSNLTHLHLEGRGVRFISNLESCYAVRVLYLYNNRIEAISGLENLRNLTHLYLQVCVIASQDSAVS